MLTGRKLKAVNNYMRGMSKRQALLDAGYAKSTALENPDSVFDNPKVAAEIERRQKKLVEANELTEQWLVDRLMAIADANYGDLVDFDEKGAVFVNWSKLDKKMRQAVAGIDIEQSTQGKGAYARPVTKLKVKPADKLRALEMLMKYLGLGKDRLEISGDQELVNRLYRAREKQNAIIRDEG